MKKPLLENTAILLLETAGCMLDRIRGACASASLKRYVPVDLITVGMMYPRRMRLGLIEALRGSSIAAPDWEVSEAHAPRPH